MSRAPGYWGGNIQKRVEQEEIAEKIKQLNKDKLFALGKDVFLWQSIFDDTPNSLVCSCVKDTTDRPDVTCVSCYGVGLIPGYLKFAHETLYMSSISTGLSLSNVVLDINIKPHRLLLDSASLNGSVTSPRLQYSNPLGLNWDFRVDSPNIKDTNIVTTSFSTDGIVYHPIIEINDPLKKPTGVGGIYLRVSMARANLEDMSPEFEMMRVRHPNKSEPYIKILRPQVVEQPALLTHGKRTENLGEKFWTMPLDCFDANIPVDTPLARIVEDAIYERIDGINKGNRFSTTKLSYNEEFGTFTQQSFETRRIQPEEIYKKFMF